MDRIRNITLCRILCLTMVVILLFLFSCSLPQSLPSSGHLVGVDGAEIYYETRGDGSPLLLLHGFGGSITAWREYLPELAKHYRVVSIDLRGHGLSTNPKNKFTHKQAALDIITLMDSLKLDRVKSIGISSGAMTLLHLATQFPDRVETMVLISATSGFTDQSRAIMRDTSFERLSQSDLKYLRSIHPRGDEQIRSLMEQFNNFQYSYDDINFTPSILSTITARTLIVHGDRDEFFPVGIPVDMYRTISLSYLWIVPNGGHALTGFQSQSQRDAFLDTVLEFLTDDWR
jgi:pimeloyl-ACP methyl ester carboxylesterase